MQIKAPRLNHPDFVLRPVEPTDTGAWYSYLSLSGVVEHTSWDLRGPEDVRALIDSYRTSTPPTSVRFALCEVDGGRLVGTVGLNSISPEAKSAELAYDLHPSFWGRGLASACCEAMVPWAAT